MKATIDPLYGTAAAVDPTPDPSPVGRGVGLNLFSPPYRGGVGGGVNGHGQNRTAWVWGLLIGWFFLCAQTSRAQDSTTTDDDPNAESYRQEAQERGGPVAQPAPDDHDSRTVRYPPPAQLDRYRNDRAYRYDRQSPPAQDPFGRFLGWILDKIQAFLQSPAYRNGWRYVLLLLIAGFTGYLLWRADVLPFALGRRSQQLPLDYDTLTDDIHAIDFGKAITEAVDRKQFRLAVRLLYLQTLKTLIDKEFISWQPNKTNRHYARELTDTPLKPGFDALTTRFEYIWYGDFPVSAEQFTGLRAEFQQFNEQAASVRPANQPVRF